MTLAATGWLLLKAAAFGVGFAVVMTALGLAVGVVVSWWRGEP